MLRTRVVCAPQLVSMAGAESPSWGWGVERVEREWGKAPGVEPQLGYHRSGSVIAAGRRSRENAIWGLT